MRAVIFANGLLNLPPDWEAIVRTADLLIAADGGGRHCLRLGLRPHALFGDLDSLTEEEVAQLTAQGAHLERYPRAKDQTDLEIALLWAVQRGARQIDLFGALGGRWDQSLANLLLAAHPRLQVASLVFHDGPQRLYPIRSFGVIHGQPGDTVSLIPLGGPAEGVTTQGLAYPLEDGRLPFGATLGVSNELVAPEATVRVQRGLLLCVVIPRAAQEALEAAKRPADAE